MAPRAIDSRPALSQYAIAFSEINAAAVAAIKIVRMVLLLI
jgi:hypothetical protein